MTTYAFCLGVNTYQAPIDALQCAERDARDLASLLKERLYFDAHYVDAHKAKDIADRLLALERNLKPGDQFIFFFSGHSKAQGNDHYFLLPGYRHASLQGGNADSADSADIADIADIACVLSWTALKKHTERTAWKGVHRIFIFDACRTHLIAHKNAGGRPAFDGRYLLGDPAFDIHQEDIDRSPLSLLNCCDLGQCAVELPGVGNGVFTLALMLALKEAAKRGHGILLDNGFVARLGQRMADLCRENGLGRMVPAPVWKGDDVRLEVAPGPVSPENLALRERDERAWQLALHKPSIAKLESYVKGAARNAPHVDEALAKIRLLKDQRARLITYLTAAVIVPIVAALGWGLISLVKADRYGEPAVIVSAPPVMAPASTPPMVAALPKTQLSALAQLRMMAAQGDANAQAALGYVYDIGREVPQDNAEALKWYRKAADQGNTQAQFNLGVMAEEGQGGEKNLTEALKWYRKAAAAGNERAKQALIRLER